MGKKQRKRNNFDDYDEEFMQPWERNRNYEKNKKEDKSSDDEYLFMSEIEIQKLKNKNKREINKIKNAEKRNRKKNFE